MNLILDTHSLLWYISGDKQLPSKVIEIINQSSNRCFISIASIWEIAIKLSLEKLEINGGFKTIEDFLIDNDFELLPIDIDDLKKILTMEFHHRDPFDRMIVAQALTTNSLIITKDASLQKYEVEILWD